MEGDELQPLVPGTDAPLPDRRPESRLRARLRQPPVPGFIFLASLALAFGADAVALRSPNETRAEAQMVAVSHQPPAFESSLWRVSRSGSIEPGVRWELSTYVDRDAGVRCARLLVLVRKAPTREDAVHTSSGSAACREDTAPPSPLETDPVAEACGLPDPRRRTPYEQRLAGVCPAPKQAALKFMRTDVLGSAEIVGEGAFREHGLSAMVLATGGSGAHQEVFFFLDGRYIGTDGPLLGGPPYSTSVIPEAGSGDTVAVSYLLYGPNDANCCPTAGAARVRYRWTGSRIEALDPIPPRRGEGVPAGR